MTDATEAERFRVTAGGLISVDGEDRNCLVLEGTADMIAEGTRHWGEEVVLLSVAEIESMRAERDRLRLKLETRCADCMGLFNRLAAEAEGLAAERDAMREALEEGAELIKGDLVGAEWKRACRQFVRRARAALTGGAKP